MTLRNTIEKAMPSITISKSGVQKALKAYAHCDGPDQPLNLTGLFKICSVCRWNLLST